MIFRLFLFIYFPMAVPKKKKSSSATKRQRNAYVITQIKKLVKKADAVLRQRKNKEALEKQDTSYASEGKTVIAA